MSQRFSFLLLRWAVVLPLIILATACDDRRPQALGEAVDSSRAVALAELLAGPGPETGRQVVVSGTIGHVCRSAGCWFVLVQDVEETHYELYVDLKPAASFTLSTAAGGRRATVQGQLVGSAPDLELHANGLVYE